MKAYGRAPYPSLLPPGNHSPHSDPPLRTEDGTRQDLAVQLEDDPVRLDVVAEEDGGRPLLPVDALAHTLVRPEGPLELPRSDAVRYVPDDDAEDVRASAGRRTVVESAEGPHGGGRTLARFAVRVGHESVRCLRGRVAATVGSSTPVSTSSWCNAEGRPCRLHHRTVRDLDLSGVRIDG